MDSMHILTCSCNKWFNHPPTLRNDMDLERNSGIYSVHFPGLSSRIWSTITYLPANIRHVARLQSVACLQVRHSATRYNAVMPGDGGLGNLGIGDTKNDNLMIDNREPWGVSIYTSQLSDSPRAPPAPHTGRRGGIIPNLSSTVFPRSMEGVES